MTVNNTNSAGNISVTGLLTYGNTLNLNISTNFTLGNFSLNLFNFTSHAGDFTAVNLINAGTTNAFIDNLGLWTYANGITNWSFSTTNGSFIYSASTPAIIGAINAFTAGTNAIITGGSTNFSVTVANAGGAGADPLAASALSRLDLSPTSLPQLAQPAATMQD